VVRHIQRLRLGSSVNEIIYGSSSKLTHDNGKENVHLQLSPQEDRTAGGVVVVVDERENGQAPLWNGMGCLSAKQG
jgi:hypothetical protein